MNCTEVSELAPLYFSGELDPERRARLTAHLGNCPGCAVELEQQGQVDARLRAGILAEPVDCQRIEHTVRSRISAASTARTRALVLAGSLAAAVILAIAIGRPTAAKVYADAAIDHRREVVERQHRNWIVNQTAVASLASQRGLPASVIPALAGPGYRFEKGKICRLNGLLFLHLVYTDGAEEFSVFLSPHDAREKPDAVRFADVGGEHLGIVETPRTTAFFVANNSSTARSLARSAATIL